MYRRQLLPWDYFRFPVIPDTMMLKHKWLKRLLEIVVQFVISVLGSERRGRAADTQIVLRAQKLLPCAIPLRRTVDKTLTIPPGTPAKLLSRELHVFHRR
jgi:hypothetical protein